MAADALSRVQGAEILCLEISVVTSDLEDLIKATYILDDNLVSVIQQLEHQSHSLVDGLIRRKGKIVVGPNHSLRSKVITWLHSNLESGHSGRELIIKRVKSLFHWKGSNKESQEICETIPHFSSL